MSEFFLRFVLGLVVISVGFVGCSNDKTTEEQRVNLESSDNGSVESSGYINGFGPSLNRPRLPEVVELYRKYHVEQSLPELRNDELMTAYRATLVGLLLSDPNSETPVEALEYTFRLLGYLKSLVSIKPEDIQEFEALGAPCLSVSEVRDLLYLNREMNKIDGGTEL